MGIGNLGVAEMAVIFVIVLVVFGPRKLPELGRSLGSAMREFRRSVNEIQREFEEIDPVKPVRDQVNSILSPEKTAKSDVSGSGDAESDVSEAEPRDPRRNPPARRTESD